MEVKRGQFKDKLVILAVAVKVLQKSGSLLENLICKEWEWNSKAGSGFFPRMFYFSVLLCQCVKTARSPAK